MKNQKLEECRLKNGLSYLDMANRLNISKTYYWQIENNKRNVYYEMAYKIAKILNKKPDDLFFDLFDKK